MWLKIGTNGEVAVLSAFVCSLGCYILTCLCEQFRLCALGQHVSKVLSQKGLFLLMTLSLGGVSCYSMNFLNLAAISIALPEAESYPAHQAPITFKVVPLVVSVFVSCVFSFLGLYVSAKDPMFAKTKKQIVEGFIDGAKEMSLKEVKAISSVKMFYVISTQSLGYLVMGGLVTGCWAIVTAGLTMWSLAIPDILLVWDWGVLVGVGIFSCFLCTVAFWILFRLLSLYPRREILRFVSAMFMAFGFVLTHFFAIDGIQVRSTPGRAMDDSVEVTGRHHLSHSLGFNIILAVVVIFCFKLMIISVVDLRSWLYESSAVAQKHEAMLNRLKGMHTDNFTLISKYLRECEHERSSHHHHSSSATHSRDKTSLLDRSVASVSGATGMLGKYLPLGRGKINPHTGDNNSVTSNATSSQVMRTPRPLSSGRPYSSGRHVSSRISESAVSWNEPLEVRLPGVTETAADGAAEVNNSQDPETGLPCQ